MRCIVSFLLERQFLYILYMHVTRESGCVLAACRNTNFVRQPQTHARVNKAIACNTAGSAFAVTLSVPRLSRSNRMSASSRLLALLAWLALCSFADADVSLVAGTTYKCLDTCGAPDGICDDGELTASGCELGTDCADCGPRLIVLVPATRYTISCPLLVRSTGKYPPWDALANLSGANINDMYLWRHWSAVWLGLQSYLRCFEPDCTVGLTWKVPRPDVTMYEAVVTDKTGNGSSTATLERAAALSQESKAGLFKALAMVVEGSVTVSAPRMVMAQASPLALAGPPPTAPPPAETEAKAAGLASVTSVCDDCNGYGYGAAEEGSDRYAVYGVVVVVGFFTIMIIFARRQRAAGIARRQRDVPRNARPQQPAATKVVWRTTQTGLNSEGRTTKTPPAQAPKPGQIHAHRKKKLPPLGRPLSRPRLGAATYHLATASPWAQPMPAKVEVVTVVVIAIVKQDADLRV